MRRRAMGTVYWRWLSLSVARFVIGWTLPWALVLSAHGNPPWSWRGGILLLICAGMGVFHRGFIELFGRQVRAERLLLVVEWGPDEGVWPAEKIRIIPPAADVVSDARAKGEPLARLECETPTRWRRGRTHTVTVAVRSRDFDEVARLLQLEAPP